MRRFGSLSFAVAASFAVMLFATRARADIVLYDKDGWGFYTRGQVAAFYQLALGDEDPTMATGTLIGGTFNSSSLANQQDNSAAFGLVSFFGVVRMGHLLKPAIWDFALR